ncbi:MAG: pyridoxal-dependent decarboxylase [Phycisphaerales bacterium]
MPPDSEPAHWSAADFRVRGHQLIDWLADYWSRLQAHDCELSVLSRVKPGEVVAPLPAAAPEHPEAWDEIWADFQRHIVPGITHWQAPGFFAFFPANGSPPAVLADLLSTGLGAQGMLWITSPACTELETRVADWTARLLALPERFLSTNSGGGVIQSTASEAALCALVAARKRAGFPSRPVVYASAQAHSSIVKAAMIAGIARGPDDRESVRLIDVDDRHALRPDALREAFAADRAAGRTPIFVCATLGTTGCLGFDDVAQIAAVISEPAADASPPRPWLHIDAAFAGSACVCPEHRWMLHGVEHADSFCFNPHKWLLTSFDCSLFYVADRRSLTDALTITPEYLRNTAPPTSFAAQTVTDYRDWQVPLGRRFRALKLWFVQRSYGAQGLRAHITRHCRLADLFASLIGADQRFELPVPRDHGLPLIVFRLRESLADSAARDAANLALMHAANAGGRIYLSHTVLPDRSVVLRLAVGGTHTTEADIRAAWEILSAGVAR